MLCQIFDDSYERMNSDDYDPKNDLPQVLEGRNFNQNRQLIFTALIIYKKGFMTITEIANSMDLFRKFTMKKTKEDGTVKEADEVIILSELGTVEELIKAMCYINKVMSPAFIRDWCLKCCQTIKATKGFFLNQRSALQSIPSSSSLFSKSGS